MSESGIRWRGDSPGGKLVVVMVTMVRKERVSETLRENVGREIPFDLLDSLIVS